MSLECCLESIVMLRPSGRISDNCWFKLYLVRASKLDQYSDPFHESGFVNDKRQLELYESNTMGMGGTCLF